LPRLALKFEKDADRIYRVVADLKTPSETINTSGPAWAVAPNIKDEFYCLNNRGIYCSKDSAGISWEKLEIPWPKEYYLQHPWALAIKE